MKAWIITNFTIPMCYRYIVWTKYVRIFTDGGGQNFRWFPKFRTGMYCKHWGMSGFYVYWLGREFWFSFKEDKKGLYKPDERSNKIERKSRALFKCLIKE